MDEQTYEEKPDAVAIAVYDERYLATYKIPYGIYPMSEGHIAGLAEGDPNAHYFFITIGTDISNDGVEWMDPEDYQVYVRQLEAARRAEEQAALEAAAEEENEVDAPA